MRLSLNPFPLFPFPHISNRKSRESGRLTTSLQNTTVVLQYRLGGFLLERSVIYRSFWSKHENSQSSLDCGSYESGFSCRYHGRSNYLGSSWPRIEHNMPAAELIARH